MYYGFYFGCYVFTLMSYISLFWVGILSVIIGLILSSAFSDILVYITQLMPRKVVWLQACFLVLLLEWGLGSAILGELASNYIFKVCAFFL